MKMPQEKEGEFTNWMGDLYERIKDRQLGEIVIPASHDSGSFSADMTGNPRTQDRDLGEQLMDGIRCFDIRVLWSGPAPFGVFEPNTFYLVHSKTTAKDLKLVPQLDKMAQFVATHHKEIIILLVSQPVSFDDGADMNKVKGDLVDLLTTKFSPHIFPNRHPPYERVSEIKVRAPIEAKRNVIIMANLEADSSARKFWGGDFRTSWAYTSYISHMPLTVEQRLSDNPITLQRFDKRFGIDILPVDIPVDAVTERPVCKENEYPCTCVGFRQVLTTLLLRRHEEAMEHSLGWTSYSGVKGIDLSQNLFDLGITFSTMDNRAAVNVVNPRCLEWLKEFERGIVGKGPRGRETTTRGQINVVSFDYYNHFPVVETLVKMNINRFPLWQDLGRLECGFGSEPAVGQNEDGRLEVFAVGKDGEVWTNCQTRDAGKWAGWNKLKPWRENGAEAGQGFEGAKASNRIAVVLGMDRRLQLFACGKDSALWNISQTAPNEGWGQWQSLGQLEEGAVITDIAVGQNKDGTLAVHVTNDRDGKIRHVRQKGINDVWANWSYTMAPGNEIPRRLSVNQDAQRRQDVVAVSDTELCHARQQEPNFNFDDREKLGHPDDRPALDVIGIARNQDGRLEAFVLCRGIGPYKNKRYVCNTWQIGQNKDWTKNWGNLGAPPKHSLNAVALGTHADGRLAVFALDDESRLWQVSQSGPNGAFGVWELLTASSPPVPFGPHLQAGRSKDGSLWLFTYDSNHVLWGLRV
jgi:hypothetical protein